MRYLLILICILISQPVNALALTEQEAVTLTLANNQRIVQFQALYDESAAGIGAARSTFYPRVDLDYAYTKRNDPPVREEEEFSVASLSASYNLFNGLSDRHNTKAAIARSDAASYQLKAVTADLILEARQAYIAQLRASRSVETDREGVDLLQRQHHDAELYYQQGLIARNDLLRVEVELSSARQELLQAEGELQIARRRLERVMGAPLAHENILEDFSELPSSNDRTNEDYRQLLSQRSELLYLDRLLAATDHERKAARGDNLPSIDLTLAYEEYGDSLSPASGDFENDQKVLLTANWNLFNGYATRQATTAAISRKRAVAAERRDTRDALLLQLQTALTDIRIARGTLQEATVGINQAEENYRVTQNRHRQQQATTVDLLDARFLLTRARNQEVNARYDLHEKAAVLDRVLEREPLR